MSERAVRALRPDELPLLTALFDYHDPEGMMAECAREMADGTLDIFGLFEADALLGELHARYESDDPREAVRGRRAYLFAFRVLKTRQGQGLGQLLLKQTLDLLAQAGYSEFTIGVEDDNPLARHIYERFGFTQVVARKSETYQGKSYPYDLLLAVPPAAEAAPPYGYCGMPCALCTRHHTQGTSRCPGCSRDGYYTEGCKAHACCKAKPLAHCGLCESFPCARLGRMSDFRDLNTGHAKERVCASVAKEGFERWYRAYAARASLLGEVLARYNNGRMKRFLCELFLQQDDETLQRIMRRAETLTGSPKELGAAFQAIAREEAAAKENVSKPQ